MCAMISPKKVKVKGISQEKVHDELLVTVASSY